MAWQIPLIRGDDVYQELLGSALSNYGIFCAQTGQLDEARSSLEEALRVRSALAERQPAEPDRQQSLAVTLHNLATFHVESQRVEEAIEASQRAIVIQRELVSSHPTVATYARDLALSLNNLGTIYAEAGDLRQATRSALGACEALKSLTNSDSCLLEGARIYGAQGNLYYQQKNWEAARDAYLAALETRDQLAQRSRQSAEYHNDRTGLEHNLGLVYAQMQQVLEAEQTMLEALAEWRELAQADSSQPIYRSNVARSYNDLTALVERQQRTDEATRYYNQAVEILETLVAKHGPAYAVQLGLGYVNLAKILETRESMADALQRYGQAIETLQPLWQASPTARQRLIMALRNAMTTSCLFGSKTIHFIIWRC